MNSLNKILVLDDEPFMLKLLAHQLGDLGFTKVIAVDNGHAALESLAGPEDQPDLILLDLNMPEMDGIEFMRQLVALRYRGSLILVSGEDERLLQAAEKLALSHNLTALGRLSKPVSPESLSMLLEQWLPASQLKSLTAKPVYSADEVHMAILNGELVNYYQPKVDTVSGKVVGVESLVRWRHPQHGMVFPDQFIGVAEAHGLINALTRVVIGEAFAQTQAWQDSGLHLQVAINISMDNLTALDFVDYLVAAAASARIEPSDIVLEVTESQLMQDMSVSLEILTRLRLRRFNLSIDDFGTGYSSLNQLRDIPFGELKVDRSFVHGAASDNTLLAIYAASMNLARQLGMKTIAEGVEDRVDWDFIRSTGCDVGQGYFIAKPMPASEIPDWIAAWESKVGNLI